MLDYQSLTDDELAQIVTDAVAEQERRQVLDRVEKDVDEMNRRYLEAAGRQPGEAWQQPTGAHDAYPAGWEVAHDGRQWVSLTPANVWAPGVSGWREVADGEAVPEWVQPTGTHDAYNTGDRVVYGTDTWESLIDGNTWSPDAYPAGWKRVETGA